jgi:hypothetical protein
VSALAYRTKRTLLKRSAHKAAHPEQYPIRDDVRVQLPSLKGIEEKCGPTNVHLQVYDGKLSVCRTRLMIRRVSRPAIVLHDQTRTRGLPINRLFRSLRHSFSAWVVIDLQVPSQHAKRLGQSNASEPLVRNTQYQRNRAEHSVRDRIGDPSSPLTPFIV